ncbi:SIS domain-containing protein [Erysipelotrichaceae bacterium Oil+RF-744-GAM-WT-6]|jgi:tagatose-6-phosphate ketose/aldose isomerase|uniref:SIS domain-containing protein n=1 Tax=Stecheria intestinalis TaxID=2606630 RepID=A0A7X2TH22_9FIRM|nr:SIS domain-containing protein [Stecheria intestinalis]MSS59091.1 SIS domain-containing protein [Stecheria intestinalis]
MKIFNYSPEELKEMKAVFTATEIHQQPDTWEKTIAQIGSMKEEIRTFLSKVLDQPDYDIILTGAGTSEFVGNALYSYLNRSLNYKVKSYASTDLTPTPENFVSAHKPTLLISFGRSGDSPESIGAIQSVEAVNDQVYHLFITCNKDGALSRRAAEEGDRCLAIDLTPETLDQSFAMTSSFSNMYLACLLCFSLDHFDETAALMREVISSARTLLDENYGQMLKVDEDFAYSRIVYLGTNCLKGIAQESALKMLELNSGKIVTMYDTPMGFRHGPKSIVNDETLTVVYLSDGAYQRQYETDLIREMAGQRKGNKIMVVCNTPCKEAEELADYYYCFNTSAKDNVFLGLDYVVCAQLIALFRSLQNKNTPDNPCPTGEVNRVVKGVTLYPYAK